MTIRSWRPIPDGQVVLEGDKTAEHWLFELLKSFSRVQGGTRTLVWQHLSVHSSSLADVLSVRYLGRLNDDDRWAYVTAIASDVGYTESLAQPTRVFNEARAVRNFVAHAQELELFTTEGRPFWHYVVSPAWEKKGVPSNLTPRDVRRLATGCKWIEYLLQYLAYLGGAKFMSFVFARDEAGNTLPQPLELLPPPPLPVPLDWEPNELIRDLPLEG